MSIIPLKYKPGVCKVNSQYSDKLEGGRFTDMNMARFEAGYPEGIWNWGVAIDDIIDDEKVTVQTSNLSSPRIIKTIRSNSGTKYVIYGTSGNLWRKTVNYISQDSNPPIVFSGSAVNITPLRSILASTLSNPFDTTLGDATVNVNHTAHGLSTNDFVTLVGGAAVGGLTISGVYHVTVTGVDDYTIEASSNATSSVTGGGGTTNYTYYRVTISNPFNTTSGSANVVVNHTSHGANEGDFVTISGASAVGGITPSGLYRINTIVTANQYRIQHSSNASSTVTGGGGTPNFLYNVSQINSSDITAIYVNRWCLDDYGQQLLINPYGDSIYIWDPTIASAAGRAYPMYNAPTGVLGMFVTPERFVFALGNSDNPRQVKWPDQDDYTDWTPSPTNTANSRTLQEGSRAVGGVAVRDGVSLVFTDTACHAFNYRGDEFIYASEVAGVKCGLPNSQTVTVMSNVAYWFSGQEFFLWNGSVQELPSDDIKDFVVNDYFYQVALIQNGYTMPLVGSNSEKNEIWFIYSSISGVGWLSSLNSNYVIFHVDQNCWSNGSLPITAWEDPSLLPLVFVGIHNTTDSTGQILSLDLGEQISASVIPTGTSYVKFSPIDISNGEANMDVFGFYPDFQQLVGPGSNGVTLTVTGQNQPQDSESTLGTFTIVDTGEPFVGMRTSSKMVGYKIQSTSDAYTTKWRLGLPRIEAQGGGGRR